MLLKKLKPHILICCSLFLFSGCLTQRDMYEFNYPEDKAMQQKMEKEYGNSGPLFFDLYKSEVLIEVQKGSVFVNIEDSRKQNNLSKAVMESDILRYQINSNCTATITITALDEEAVVSITNNSKTTEYVIQKSDFKGKTIIISNFI